MHPAFTPVLAADKKQAIHFFFITNLYQSFPSLKVPISELQNCRLVLDSSPEPKDINKAPNLLPLSYRGSPARFSN